MALRVFRLLERLVVDFLRLFVALGARSSLARTDILTRLGAALYSCKKQTIRVLLETLFRTARSLLIDGSLKLSLRLLLERSFVLANLP